MFFIGLRCYSGIVTLWVTTVVLYGVKSKAVQPAYMPKDRHVSKRGTMVAYAIDQLTN